MKYSLVIFDWDGTLMDSTARITDCLARAAADAGLPPLPEPARRGIIGLGLIEAIRTLYPQAPDRQVLAMRDHYAEHYIAAERVPSSLFPGVLDTLGTLREAGVQMAVATGKSRRGLDRVWSATGLGQWFQASRCADESRSKPAPDMVLELLAELSVPAERALVVGDTTFDLDMARQARVDRVGVSYGAHAPSRLRGSAPLALIDHMAQLPPLLGLPAPVSPVEDPL